MNDSRSERSRRVASVARPTPELTAIADRILDVVPRAMRRIRNEIRSAGQPDLSVPQLRVLMYVRRHPGAGLSAVAEHVGLSRAGASALVDRLVRAGLLDRADDPDERRRIQLRLTGSGAEHVGRAHLAVRELLAVELSGLDAGELEQLGPALAVLERIATTERAP